MHYADRRQGLELPAECLDVQAGKRLPKKLLGISQKGRAGLGEGPGVLYLILFFLVSYISPINI